MKLKQHMTITNFIVIIVLTIFFQSCVSHYTYFTNGTYNSITSHTLSIKKDRYILLKRKHSNYFTEYNGYLIKVNHRQFALHDYYQFDKINYPISFRIDSVNDDSFKLDISSFLLYNKIFLNDTLYLDTTIKRRANMPNYISFVLAKRPEHILLCSKVYKDDVFDLIDFEMKSIRYRIPIFCNHVKIDNIGIDSLPIGLKNLRFNRKTMILSSDSNEVKLIKYDGIVARRDRKANSIILRRNHRRDLSKER